MIQSRNYFAPVGFADFESPHKPRQPSQVRRSLTGSFSGPISDEELKQSFHSMRQSSTSQTTHPTAVFNPTAQTTHPTAAFNPTAPNSQLNDDVGVGIYFVKNEREGHFFVQKLLPGYSAEMCGSISTGDIVTHVGAYKIPPELTLDKLRPLIVGPAGTCVSLTFQRGSERDESYGFYQVNLTRGQTKTNQPMGVPSPASSPAAGLRGFQSVGQINSSGLQRATNQRNVPHVAPARTYEQRAAISLDYGPPASSAQLTYSDAASVRSSHGAPPPIAPLSQYDEATALIELLERMLRDSNTRSQQAKFSTILRDFDLCAIKRAADA